MKVIKRDGTPQEYNFLKIVDAVTEAFKSVEQDVPDKFIEQLKESVERLLIKNNGNGTNIEEIQDCIQKELIKRNKYDVVESFINYRRKRQEYREQNSDMIKQIQDKLYGRNIVNQNANLDEESFGGRVGEAGSIVCKNEALKMMSTTARRNHERNEVYTHDLDAYADGRHNCLSVPFDKILNNGVTTRQTDVRPAGSVNTALQLVAVNFQLQSLQQFGGVSATHLDWTMVPFVRKSFVKHLKDGLKYIDNMSDNVIEDILKNINITKTSIDDDLYRTYDKSYQYALDMTLKEVHQGIEGLYHNLNTLQSRSGNQLPFTSINTGTCTLTEGRMITRSLLEVSMEGLGKNGVTSIFPCLIFQLKKGINLRPEDPNYDLKRLACKCTAMRIYPNYANCDWSNQVRWTELDRREKQEYIDNLSSDDYNKLLQKLENNLELQELIGLYIDNSEN